MACTVILTIASIVYGGLVIYLIHCVTEAYKNHCKDHKDRFGG